MPEQRSGTSPPRSLPAFPARSPHLSRQFSSGLHHLHGVVSDRKLPFSTSRQCVLGHRSGREKPVAGTFHPPASLPVTSVVFSAEMPNRGTAAAGVSLPPVGRGPPVPNRPLTNLSCFHLMETNPPCVRACLFEPEMACASYSCLLTATSQGPP